MHRDRIRDSLAWGLAATLLLPIILAVVLGLGGLLGGLGDTAAAAVCRRCGLALGALWLTAIAATTAINAVAAIQHHGQGARDAHRQRPRRGYDRGVRRMRHRRSADGRGRGRRRHWLREEDRLPPGIGEPASDRPA